ncbi:MAG: cadherin-like domain-containing protein [Verrucomicrobia bacterium]|nr:cadherin-like domain-containing protein [Verrucomicrobiota bacterium]
MRLSPAFRRRACAAAALTVGSLASLPAAPLTPGSLLVYTIDVGTGSLTSAATPVVIREFATTGSPATNYQNFSLPTTGAGAMTASGTAASDGQLLRSADGAIASWAGYNVASGTASVTSTILRLYATLDPSGTLRYSVPFTISGTNVRGAIASSAATGFYIFTADGFGYAPTLEAEVLCVTGQYSVRGATIFNGRIYGSTGSTTSNNGVNLISDGLPAGPAYYQQLPGFTNATNESPNAIRFHDLNNDGQPDTLYVAVGATGGGVKRYNFNGTSWVLAYTLNASTPTGFYGLTSRIDPGDSSRLQFFATTQGASNAGNRLVTFTDSATFGNTTSPGAITLTQLRQAPATQSFRGVDFSPAVAAPIVVEPTVTNLTNTSARLGGNVTSDGSSTITARGVVYAPTATNSNPQLGGPGVLSASASGTTGAFTVDVSGLSGSTGYSFAAYATNPQGTRYSAVGTFTTSTPPQFTSADNAVFTLGTAGSFTVTAVGPPAPTLSLTGGTLPPGVTFTAASGLLAGTPSAGMGGSFPLVFTAANGATPNATQNFTLVLNTPPVAGSDTLAAARNTPVALPAARLLLNDRDADGDALAVTGVSPASGAGGTVGLAGGTLTYTPPNGFTGQDSFTYTIADGRGGVATGTVVVTVGGGSGATQNFVSLDIGPGGAQLRWRGIAGLNYRIQYSDDLGASWQDFPGTVSAGGTGAIDFLDATIPLPPQRFYRTAITL